MIYCNEYDHVGTDKNGQAVARVDLVNTTLPATMPLTSEGIENCPVAKRFLPMSTFLVTSTKKVYVMNTDNAWDEM